MIHQGPVITRVKNAMTTRLVKVMDRPVPAGLLDRRKKSGPKKLSGVLSPAKRGEGGSLFFAMETGNNWP